MWGYGGDAAFVLPALGTNNYVMTARVKGWGGQAGRTSVTVGIITDIDGTLAAATTSRRFAISYDHSVSDKPVNGAYTRVETNPNNDVFATLNNSYSFSDYFTVSVVSYDGTNYYFINGDYIISQKKANLSNERIGFFTYQADAYFDDITVNKLNDPVTPEESYAVNTLGLTVGEELINEPFSSGNMSSSVVGSSNPMPNTAVSGWEFSDSATGTALFHNGDGKFKINNGCLNMWCYNGDAAFVLPALNTSDYIMSAKLKGAGGQEGSTAVDFGIITDIDGTLATATTSRRFAITYDPTSADKTVGGMFTRVSTNSANNKNVTLENSYSVKDYVSVTVISYGGQNYYFVDGDYITSQSKADLENERIGFFVYRADAYFDDISVKALSLPASDEEVKLEEIGAVMGDELLNEDFANITVSKTANELIPIPDTKMNGWEFSNDSAALWKGQDSYMSIKNGVVNIWNYSGGEAAVTLPDLNTSDYYMTFKVKSTYANGGFMDILTDVDGSLKDATGSVRLRIRINGSSEVTELFTRIRNSSGDLDTAITDFGTIKTDGFITVGVMSFEGINYYFVNGSYVGSAEKTVSENERIGFGIGTCDVYFDDVVVKELLDKENPISVTSAITVAGDSVQYADRQGVSNEGAAGLRINTTVNTDDRLFDTDKEIAAGVIVKITDDILFDDRSMVKNGLPAEGTVSVKVDADKNDTFDLLGIAPEVDDYFFIRGFISLDGKYYYSNAVMVCPAFVAEEAYLTTDDEDIKSKLHSVYGASEKFQGADSVPLTFTALSDFHYEEGMYPSTIADLESIFARADESNSDFVLSLGDFCNNLRGSPELSNTFLGTTDTSGKLIPAYNIYGNHELESDYSSDALKYVTEHLTNQSDNVVWGTPDGKIAADGSIGYYYFEQNGFRIICIDANYSWNEEGYWEHNRPGSWGAPTGNVKSNSLGDIQLKWLEKVLLDAADKGLSCIVATHQSLQPSDGSCRDAAAVREMFRKVNNLRKGTVLMSIAGHTHANSSQMYDGVFYLMQNATRNYASNVIIDEADRLRYSDDVMYTLNKYDSDGNFIGAEEISVNELTGAGVEYGTYFTLNPLSSVVTIDRAGNITVEGIYEPEDKNNVEAGYNDISYGSINPIHINTSSNSPWQNS